MSRTSPSLVAVLFLGIQAAHVVSLAGGPAPAPVVASIATTLQTDGEQIRQFAFDGDPLTYFASKEAAGLADHFTLVFDAPVSLKSIVAVTGRPDRVGTLESGTLEVSADGKAFEVLAPFVDGAAHAEANSQALRAIRIRPGTEFGHALVVSEITIESDPPVVPFRDPVEFVVDVSDVPEMREWAENMARVCERAFPMINEELKSAGHKPPHLIPIRLKSPDEGVARAGGGRITGSARYFKDHPDDLGAMVHETAHIVQGYRGRNNPGWLVEGVADYVRFFKFEPGKLGRIDPDQAHYDSSYRVTAAFLAYVTETYDKRLVNKLNRMMREGTYKEDVFKDLTGKTVRELDKEWRATLVQ